MITQAELRSKISNMTKQEFISLRDELESNWSESLRAEMSILSLGCINKFKTTLANLK